MIKASYLKELIFMENEKSECSETAGGAIALSRQMNAESMNTITSVIKHGTNGIYLLSFFSRCRLQAK